MPATILKPATAPLTRWTQTIICLLVAGAVCAGFVLVDLAARSDTINDWLLARQLVKWKATNSKFQYSRGYVDFEGRLIYGEIPEADYSNGGVYFFGSSVVKNSIMDWELPPAERKLIHNYALSGSGPLEWTLFVRFLVEDAGWLEAGGEKTTAIFGLHFLNFNPDQFSINEGLVQRMFTRHGLYDFSPEGIHYAQLAPLQRFMKAEKARCANFLHYAFGHMAFRDKPLLTEDQKAQYYRIYAAEDWSDFDQQLQMFARLVDYLRSKGVTVAVYFAPLGSWVRGQYGEVKTLTEFREKSRRLCKEMNIPVLEIDDLLTDDEFFDSAHANYPGQAKMHPHLADFAREFLYRQGSLPRPAAQPPASADDPTPAAKSTAPAATDQSEEQK